MAALSPPLASAPPPHRALMNAVPKRATRVLWALGALLLAAGAAAQTTTDYDDDNDNLIDIRTLAQLSVDDAGRAGGAVSVTVPAGEALWLSASELESGGDGFEGSLGDGEGKWRLTVSSAAPLAVMSLVEDEQGALSNLSTPGRR